MIDAYKIGISIALTNNVSQVLNVIAKDVLGLHGHVKETEAAFGRMRLAIAGAAGLLGSAAILGTLKTFIEAAKEFRVEQSRLAGAGFTPDQVARATATGWNVATSTPGVNLEHTLAHQRELREILGTPEAAAAASPLFEKLGVALGAQTGVDVEGGMKFLAKAMEIQAQEHLFDRNGQFSEAEFKSRMDAAYRFMVAANGFVSPSQMNSMLQQAGVGAQMTDYQNFWRQMLMPAIEQNAVRAGTGLAADFRTINSGIVGKDRQAEWVAAGLAHYEGEGKSKKFALNKTGQQIIDGPGGIEAYVNQQLVPFLLKHLKLKDISEPGAVESMRAWIQKNESVETARRSLSVFLNQIGMRKAEHNYDTTPGFEQAYDTAMAMNPDAKIKAFEESWHSLMVALGNPLVDHATDILLVLSKRLNDLTAWAAKPENQKTIEGLEDLAAGIAALMALGGTIAIGTVAIKALIKPFGALISVMGGSEMAAATGGISLLASALGRLALGPVGAFLMGMKPTTIDPDGTEAKGLAALKGMSPQDRAAAMDPKSWKAPPSGGAMPLDSLLDKLGIRGGPTTPVQAPPPPSALKSSYLPDNLSGGAPVIHTVTNVQLDGRTIATAVSDHQGSDWAGPATGTTGFDGRVSPMSPGALVGV